MPNIARKGRMGQNLNKMLRAFPKDYSYYPRTWILPQELSDFRQQFDSNGNSIGIFIFIFIYYILFLNFTFIIMII